MICTAMQWNGVVTGTATILSVREPIQKVLLLVCSEYFAAEAVSTGMSIAGQHIDAEMYLIYVMQNWVSG